MTRAEAERQWDLLTMWEIPRISDIPDKLWSTLGVAEVECRLDELRENDRAEAQHEAGLRRPDIGGWM